MKVFINDPAIRTKENSQRKTKYIQPLQRVEVEAEFVKAGLNSAWVKLSNGNVIQRRYGRDVARDVVEAAFRPKTGVATNAA